MYQIMMVDDFNHWSVVIYLVTCTCIITSLNLTIMKRHSHSPGTLHYFSLGLLTISLMAATGCATSGLFPSTHLTNVELSENNYRIVAKNVGGQASAGYILGLSGAFRGEMQTFGLIRISGEGMLYQEALDSLWRTFEQQYGQAVEGSRLALVNVRYDAEALNVLGFYTKPTVVIRADIIEFTD